MSLVVPLLRLLLCLVLVLNGAGAAAASVRMSGPVQEPAAASHADNDAHAVDCASHPVEHGGNSGTGSHPDCCKSASCTCACVHGCATMLSMPVSAPVIIAHAGISVPLPTGHPAPALPHLIRPPIR